MILFGLFAHAQKTFVVYNLTSTTIDLYDIVANQSGSYPQFQSKGTTISIAPGGSYTLQNLASTTRFPFLSPTSSPPINNWVRTIPPTSVVPSLTAWIPAYNQVFSSLSFGETGFSLGIITPTSGTISYVGVPPATSWTADYYMIVNPANPNDITYMVVIQ